MRLGVHVSIAGGLPKAVERAEALRCDTFQIFCRNPRSWAFREPDPGVLESFRTVRAGAGIYPAIVHTTYLINLASPDEDLFKKSVDLFCRELGLAEDLGAEYLVTHMGSSSGLGVEFAKDRILRALGEVKSRGLGEKTTILFENTSGGGHTVGADLRDIGSVIRRAEERGLTAGLCFDTCHGFAAGYPMADPGDAGRLVETIMREAGGNSLKVIHLNDSKGAFLSKVDRHEHIGLGQIPLGFFTALVNHPSLKRVPFILETPRKSAEDDQRNLGVVRKMRRKS